MERTLSPDERIRRAEEIYYRRKSQDINKKSAKVNVSNKKDFGMFKKMIIQILICVAIYGAFYMIKNTNHIFSEDVIKNINEILSYDINIKKLYEQYSNYVRDVGAGLAQPVNNIIESNSTNTIDLNTTVQNQINEDNINQNLENQNTNFIEEQNIGGANAEDMKETENIEEPIYLAIFPIVALVLLEVVLSKCSLKFKKFLPIIYMCIRGFLLRIMSNNIITYGITVCKEQISK